MSTTTLGQADCAEAPLSAPSTPAFLLDSTLAIIGAMDVEIEKLLPEIEQRKDVIRRGHTYHTGHLCGQRIVITRSGIGKVNAAVTTTELINNFAVDALIFTGIAGATAPELEPNDVVISTALVQHDIDLTMFGHPLGHITGFDDRLFPANETLITLATAAAQEVVGHTRVSQGIIATGDRFIADPTDVQTLHQEFEAKAVEMEGAAVAQVAHLYNKPLVVIRTISDKADGSARMDYAAIKSATAHNSSRITLKMLEKIFSLNN